MHNFWKEKAFMCICCCNLRLDFPWANIFAVWRKASLNLDKRKPQLCSDSFWMWRAYPNVVNIHFPVITIEIEAKKRLSLTARWYLPCDREYLQRKSCQSNCTRLIQRRELWQNQPQTLFCIQHTIFLPFKGPFLVRMKEIWRKLGWDFFLIDWIFISQNQRDKKFILHAGTDQAAWQLAFVVSNCIFFGLNTNNVSQRCVVVPTCLNNNLNVWTATRIRKAEGDR